MKFQMNITTSYDDVCRFFSADDLKSFYKSHGCDGLEVMPLDNYDPADLAVDLRKLAVIRKLVDGEIDRLILGLRQNSKRAAGE